MVIRSSCEKGGADELVVIVALLVCDCVALWAHLRTIFGSPH
jgi:hypothetical protein